MQAIDVLQEEKKMKGIYLGACRARHPSYDLVYQDINPKFHPDIEGDMLCVNLEPYDFVIATPPCNYWSKANPYYWYSLYALKTMHLLPSLLIKLKMTGKPFLVENVKNIKRMRDLHIFDICAKFCINVQFVGRHTYFTNLEFVDLSCRQRQDFKIHGKCINKEVYGGSNQGGSNVGDVVEIWLSYLTNPSYATQL